MLASYLLLLFANFHILFVSKALKFLSLRQRSISNMADLEKQNTYTVHRKSIKNRIQKTGELVYLGINQNSFTSSKLWHKSRPISLNRLLTSFSNIKMSIPLLTLLFMSFLLTLWFQGKRSAFYIDSHILYLLCWRYRVFFELLWFFFPG